MKTHSFYIIALSALALGLSACFPVRIVTTAPTETVYVKQQPTTVVVRETTPAYYPVQTTTVVTAPSKPTTTTTVKVTSLTNDLSYYLDLQAVAAAFAQSGSVNEFEQLLNSSRYMINNLDLNNDGYVDYLRVLEGQQGYRHVYLIQACLAPSVFQDVATLVAEAQTTSLYVEVIGDPYIYGSHYIVRPVWVKRPPMWDVMRRTNYVCWHSPYYYGHHPSYYEYMKCVYLSHYMAYVESYMHNNHYCHHCDYPSSYYYPQYTEVTRPHTRQDYATQYPQNSFSNRNAKVYTATTGSASGSSAAAGTRSVRNTAELRQAASASGATTRTPATSTSSGRSTSTTTSTPASSGRSTSTTTSTPASSGRSTSTTTSTPASSGRSSSSSASSSATRTPSTTVTTRVNSSGATRTTIRTTDENGRTTSTQRTSTTAPSRSAGTSTRTSTSGSSTRTSTSGSTPRTSSGTSTRDRR